MAKGIAPTEEEKTTNKEKIIEYFDKTPGGTFSGACKYAGVTFSAGYLLRSEDEEFNKQVNESRDRSNDIGGDFAESKLMEAIGNNELTGIIFYLKTKHKHRGYVERLENTGKDGEPLQVTINKNVFSADATDRD